MRNFWQILGAYALGVIIGLTLCTNANAVGASGTPSPRPDCWSSTHGGTGGPIFSGGNVDGQYMGWWCPLVDGTWRDTGILSLHGHIWQHPITPVTTVKEFLSSYWDYNVRLPTGVSVPRTDLNTLYLAAAAATKPSNVQVIWEVAYTSYGSRPVYNIVNGALTPAVGRATIGFACNCTTPFIKDASTYCIPAGFVKEVTLCKVRKSP